MKEQYEHVKTELETTYLKEIEAIKGVESDQLKMIEEEMEQLQTYIENCNGMNETGEQLLGETWTMEFIRDAINFLSSNQIRDLPEVIGKNVKMIQYMEPLCRLHADPGNLHVYLEKHVLGYFSPYRRKGLSHPQRSLYRLGYLTTGSLKSLQSLSEDSCLTDFSPDNIDEDKSLPDHTIATQPVAKTTAELTSSTNIKRIKLRQSMQLKTISSVLFKGDTMWLCGWNKNVQGHKDIALLNVRISDYTILLKQKRRDPMAELPVNMCSFNKCLFMAKKGEKEVCMFNTESQKFKKFDKRRKLLCNSHMC